MGALGTVHLLDASATQPRARTIAPERPRTANEPWRKRGWIKLGLVIGSLVAAGVLVRVTVLR